MSCKYSKEALIDYFYNELSGEERAACEAHIKECEGCRLELDELRSASQSLQVWKSPELKARFIFTREQARWYGQITAVVSALKRHPITAAVAGIAACFLVLSFMNFNVSYNRQSGNFTVSTSLFRASQPEIDYEILTEKLEAVQRRNIDVMNQMLTDYEIYRRQQTDVMMANFAQSWQQQRMMDIDAINTSLFTLQQMTDEGLHKNLLAAIELIETAIINPAKYETIKK